MISISNTVSHCEGCPSAHRGACITYSEPIAFVRDNGMFMCPIKGYAKTIEVKGNVGRVRVGQQKQKSFKQQVMGRK